MNKKDLKKRLITEIEEKIISLDDYIYVVRDNNNNIPGWYYTDSVEDLKTYQNYLFNLPEYSSIPYDIKRGFDKYIEKLAKINLI